MVRRWWCWVQKFSTSLCSCLKLSKFTSKEFCILYDFDSLDPQGQVWASDEMPAQCERRDLCCQVCHLHKEGGQVRYIFTCSLTSCQMSHMLYTPHITVVNCHAHLFMSPVEGHQTTYTCCLLLFIFNCQNFLLCQEEGEKSCFTAKFPPHDALISRQSFFFHHESTIRPHNEHCL